MNIRLLIALSMGAIGTGTGVASDQKKSLIGQIWHKIENHIAKNTAISCKLPSSDTIKEIVCPDREGFCERTNLPNKLAGMHHRPTWIADLIEVELVNDFFKQDRKLHPLYDQKEYMERLDHYMDQNGSKIVTNLLKNCDCHWTLYKWRTRDASHDDIVQRFIATGHANMIEDAKTKNKKGSCPADAK